MLPVLQRLGDGYGFQFVTSFTVEWNTIYPTMNPKLAQFTVFFTDATGRRVEVAGRVRGGEMIGRVDKG